MSDKHETLVMRPKVFVVGKTEFDREGLADWMEMRGFETTEYFLNSPIKRIADGTTGGLTPEQDGAEIMAEFAGRFCYNSFLAGRDSPEYLANVVEMRHGSVLEHVSYNLAIEGVSRSLTHELIRHRAGFAVSQESQRFVDAKDIKFVVPPALLSIYEEGDPRFDDVLDQFSEDCEKALGGYKRLQERIVSRLAELKEAGDVKAATMFKKRANEAARALLPNAAETKLVWTGNLRALRHFCELRGDDHADLEIRRLASAIAEAMMERAPYTFFDMETVDGVDEFDVPAVRVRHSKV